MDIITQAGVVTPATVIGDALGITRQAAHRHYRRHRWDPDTQTVWTEPPLPLGRN